METEGPGVGLRVDGVLVEGVRAMTTGLRTGSPGRRAKIGRPVPLPLPNPLPPPSVEGDGDPRDSGDLCMAGRGPRPWLGGIGDGERACIGGLDTILTGLKLGLDAGR